jgi:hypothetical protein
LVHVRWPTFRPRLLTRQPPAATFAPIDRFEVFKFRVCMWQGGRDVVWSCWPLLGATGKLARGDGWPHGRLFKEDFEALSTPRWTFLSSPPLQAALNRGTHTTMLELSKDFNVFLGQVQAQTAGNLKQLTVCLVNHLL